MTKILTLILVALALALPASAQNQRVVVQDGRATNQVYNLGGSAAVLLNRIGINGSLLSGANTNIAIVLRGMKLNVPSGTLSVGIGGSGSADSVTNAIVYSFERSFNTVNWSAWTNISVVPNGTNAVWTNATFNLGDWHYVRVSNITNANASFWSSNQLEFYWRE